MICCSSVSCAFALNELQPDSFAVFKPKIVVEKKGGEISTVVFFNLIT